MATSWALQCHGNEGWDAPPVPLVSPCPLLLEEKKPFGVTSSPLGGPRPIEGQKECSEGESSGRGKLSLHSASRLWVGQRGPHGARRHQSDPLGLTPASTGGCQKIVFCKDASIGRARLDAPPCGQFLEDANSRRAWILYCTIASQQLEESLPTK